MALASAALLIPSAMGWLPMARTEVLGFVTGGVCVWLVVRQHMANWPVGLANNVFFFVLFWQGRLFADAVLQVVYFGLGIWGWYQWKFGGEERRELKVSRCRPDEWLLLAITLVGGTILLREVLLRVNGAAPLGDALTTVLSLQAQVLLCRKRLENWFFWIAADLIYVPFYLSRGLPLTAALYTLFLGMCLAGLSQWRRSWREQSA